MTGPARSVKAATVGTGAPPVFEMNWDQINWDQVNEEVTRLQVRIAKATQASRWNKVQVLQRLLTSSHSGKLLAVKRVTENAGKKTAGVDGKIWTTPASKLKAARLLTHRGYQPLPLRRVYIPKSNGKERPLGIPCMFDRAMQALWLLALNPIAETTADPNSYGFRPKRPPRQKSKVNVIRYADDFVVTGVTRELLEQCVKPTVEKFLATRGLQLAPEKTLITHISRGFDFLGQNVRKYGEKLLIKPSHKSVKSLLGKVREVLKKNMAATQAQVIMLLNPILRGWAMYHRHVVASATFTKVDHLVWKMLWTWAKRRHPQKNYGWIKARYFRRFAQHDWIFACSARGYKQLRHFVLFRAETLPIQRHTKVRGEANPFDPAWASYFQRRSPYAC